MKSKIIALAALIFSSPLVASNLHPRAVCGWEDERSPSADPSVAKIVKNAKAKGGCTATLIGNSCMVSAGHCTSSMRIAQFDSRDDHSVDPKNVYLVDRKSIQYADYSTGADYAVFKVLPNALTGEVPGKTRRPYRVRFSEATIGDQIRISGYGKSQDKKISFTQQTHNDILRAKWGTVLAHRIDTDSGNSGAAIVLEHSAEIIGVHTNGGCSPDAGANKGTSIANNPKFIEMIEKCLASDP